VTTVVSAPSGSTQRRVAWSRRQVVAAVLIGVVGGLFLYDLIWLEPRNDARADFVDTSDGNPLTAVLLLRNLRHDRSARALLADVHVEVRSINDAVITSMAVSVRTTGDGLRKWLLVPSSLCERLRTNDHDISSVPYRTSAQTTCGAVQISDDLAAGEIWYPFDRHSTLINPQICINTDSVVACAQGTASRVRTTRVDAEPTAMEMAARFTETGARSAILVLERRFFLRMVSVLCLIMSVIFVTYLIRVADPKETMKQSLGVFAALWGFRELIVPGTVTAFPTVVDFTILTIFCVVFALVLVRSGNQPSTGKEAMVK
jgi:hypothetical protein